jgi:hypothetical protein
MLAGVLIRQFFVLRHKGRTLWLLPSIADRAAGGPCRCAQAGARAPSTKANAKADTCRSRK